MEINCRCEITSPDQFSPCYASVVVVGSSDPRALEQKVTKLEEKIWSNTTAWCHKCRHPCMITRNLGMFKTISAHHVHQIKEFEHFKNSKLFD